MTTERDPAPGPGNPTEGVPGPGIPAGRTPAVAVPVAPWQQTAEQVAAAYGVEPAKGLTGDTAAETLRAVGPNQLAEQRRRPAWLRFLDQFRSVLILVLLGAAVLAGLVGELKDTLVIAVVLIINATIGFVQEARAERSLDALRQMLSPTTRVRRGGVVTVIDAADVVPGDVVLLEAGDRVPADGRLTLAAAVEVDESALTGESMPVAKTVNPVPEAPAGSTVALAERRCMLHMNTALTRGRAEMVVTATGMQTELGAIAELLNTGHEPPSPLQQQLDSLGKRLALIGGIAVSVYAGLALARGDAIADLALRAVALAVATVPEGLPAVLALTLALGVQRMARRSAIVKRLAAVETLGSATVICSDKTGTLTMNAMTVREVVVGGRRVELVDADTPQAQAALADQLPAELIRGAVLCSDARLGPDGLIGDPTETALVALGQRAGRNINAMVDAHPRLAEIPFDPAYKYMATVHPLTGGHATGWGSEPVRVYVKGAADVLLARCRTQLTEEGDAELSAADRQDLLKRLDELAGQGLRVLAVAAATWPSGPAPDADLHDRIDGLTLLGLVGIADPPRPEARAAIRLCARAGVAVKMITGDHAATAGAIAAELGIPGRVVTGADLDRLSAAELAAQVEEIGVFARVAPEHKVAVVQALTGRGQVVAMTGDGVNDAAALRSAHIGVAMGITGTEVTKEAADMILTDDNFATIVGAVEEGRGIYDNVVKFVRFQLSTNMGAIFTFLGSAILGVAAPLTAVQILWVNIIMDGPPAMALGVDPPRRGLMDQPPRRQADRILSGPRIARLVRVGLVMAGATLTMLLTATSAYGAVVGLTMTFTTFVLLQLFNALNARSEHTTIFSAHLFTNRWLWFSLAAVLLLQIAAVHTPVLQPIFDTTDLTPLQWLLCLTAAISVLAVEELVKLVTPRSRRPGPDPLVGSAPRTAPH